MSYATIEHNSLDICIEAGSEGMADINTKMTNGAIHIADLCIKQGTTNIEDAITAGTAKIITLGRGGGGAGGGGGTIYDAGLGIILNSATHSIFSLNTTYTDERYANLNNYSANIGDLLINGDMGIGTNDPKRMVHVNGSNANFLLERHSPFGATFFFSNVYSQSNINE